MKTGCCLLLLATPDDPLARRAVPLAGQSGYDYAEVSLARLLLLDARETAAYRKLLDEARLPAEVFNNAIPKGMALIGPHADPVRLEDYIHRSLSAAEQMGTGLITMSGPNRATVPEGFDWERDGFPQYLEFLHRFGTQAAERGVSLAIEPINDEEHSFVSTLSDAQRAADACGCGNVGVIVDFYHFCKQQDSPDSLMQLCRGQKLRHIHYAAYPERTYPLQDDLSACRDALEPLFSAGYQGRVSIEAYARNPVSDLPEACRLLHNLF